MNPFMHSSDPDEPAGIDVVEEKRILALEMRLIHGKTIAAIAQEMGVSSRSVYKWFAEPKTRAIIQKYRAGQIQELMDIALDGSEQALQAMVNLVNDQTVAPIVRLQAARQVMDVTFRLLEATDISERLERIEENLKGKLGLM